MFRVVKHLYEKYSPSSFSQYPPSITIVIYEVYKITVFLPLVSANCIMKLRRLCHLWILEIQQVLIYSIALLVTSLYLKRLYWVILINYKKLSHRNIFPKAYLDTFLQQYKVLVASKENNKRDFKIINKSQLMVQPSSFLTLLA